MVSFAFTKVLIQLMAIKTFEHPLKWGKKTNSVQVYGVNFNNGHETLIGNILQSISSVISNMHWIKCSICFSYFNYSRSHWLYDNLYSSRHNMRTHLIFMLWPTVCSETCWLMLKVTVSSSGTVVSSFPYQSLITFLRHSGDFPSVFFKSSWAIARVSLSFCLTNKLPIFKSRNFKFVCLFIYNFFFDETITVEWFNQFD